MKFNETTLAAIALLVTGITAWVNLNSSVARLDERVSASEVTNAKLADTLEKLNLVLTDISVNLARSDQRLENLEKSL